MDIVPEGQAPLSFAAMELPSEILRALEEQGITTPTLIQQRSIPLIASGHDVIGMSKTGSGKTIAFGAPCLQLLASRAGVQVLILAPTRELAVQIAGELRKLGKYLRFSIATVYGGVALGPQVERIERSEVVVGTPGRILDHLERGSLRLDRARCVVLDEADKMAEMGFIEDVQRIMDKPPEGRQVLLFGATLTDDIERITKRYMRSPTIARAEAQVEGEYLQQFFYEVEAHEKFSLLVHLLQTEQRKQSIVFCSRISRCRSFPDRSSGASASRRGLAECRTRDTPARGAPQETAPEASQHARSTTGTTGRRTGTRAPVLVASGRDAFIALSCRTPYDAPQCGRLTRPRSSC